MGAVSGAIIGTMRDAQHSALPPSSGGSGGAGATINVSVRPGNLGTFNVVSQSSVPIGQTSTLLNFTLPDGSSRFTGFTSTNNQVLLSQTSFGSSVAYTTSANFAGTSNLVITWTDGNGVTQTSTATVVAT